jgi:hypothetical protein
VVIVEVAALGTTPRAGTELLKLYAGDAQGRAAGPLPSSPMSAQLAAFARSRPPPPVLDTEARLGISLVNVRDGQVSFRYDGRTLRGLALARERQFLFHVHGDGFQPNSPPLASSAPVAEPASESGAPRELFDRLSKDLIERVRSAAKLGI